MLKTSPPVFWLVFFWGGRGEEVCIVWSVFWCLFAVFLCFLMGEGEKERVERKGVFLGERRNVFYGMGEWEVELVLSKDVFLFLGERG